MAPQQLRLVSNSETPEAPHDWRISDETRAVGRAGIARARQALAEAKDPRRRFNGDDDPGHPRAA